MSLYCTLVYINVDINCAAIITVSSGHYSSSLASHSPSLITDQSLGHYRGWVGRMCFVRNNSDRGQRIVFTANTVAADTG